MNPQTLNLLEFNSIKSILAELTGSNLGRQMVESLTPRTNPAAVAGVLRETTEARQILDSSGAPPLGGLTDIDKLLDLVKAGKVMEPAELSRINTFMRACRKTRDFMERRTATAGQVAGYALGITPCVELEAEIDRCIIDDTVSSEASATLKKLRKELSRVQDKIKAKLNQLILSPEAKLFLQEPVVSFKDSRPVLMVKAGQKQRLPGLVLGSSGSGNTLFVEPLAIHQLSNELRTLETAEQEEVYQILAGLSGAIYERLPALETNVEIMVQYDFAFAKARLSRKLKAVEPAITTSGIDLIQARHPLLYDPVIPLDCKIGEDYRTLVITGPNTGGKTVAIKTVGLLTLMAQAGLHIPAAPDSTIAVFKDILADIGDGQNISQSLSTFSAHITNIITIMQQSSADTLVLLDEVGTGTDPVEGAALAIAILEYIHHSGAITLASTHYPEIKHYALATPGFKNGCMAFDRENLQPLYRLIIGQAGASQALWIAKKLGMPLPVLLRAEQQIAQTPEMVQAPSPDRPSESTAAQPGAPAGPLEKPGTLSAPVNPNPTPTAPPVRSLKVGDLVSIPYLNEKGIVCSLPDPKGRIRVLIKDKKMEIAAKRVKLQIPAEELYPEDYDLNIVLLNKTERRLKQQMRKGRAHGVMRPVPPEEI